MLVTTLVGKTLVSSALKCCCCVGCQPGTAPSNSQPRRAEKFSAPAKQPELQRNSPKEEKEFVLNTGLISILLRLSPPAIWQPRRERSPLQVAGKQVPHSLEVNKSPFISIHRVNSSHDKSPAVDPGAAQLLEWRCQGNKQHWHEFHTGCRYFLVHLVSKGPQQLGG